MLSIIVCSISPVRLHNVEKNIRETIGREYEIIAIDNREKKWSIAKAYNYGAQKAKYPYLFFMHEDVSFLSKDWGDVIEQKMMEPDCGVIGFAGSKIKLNCYSGWNQYYKWVCCFLYQDEKSLSRLDVFNVYFEHPFEEVITLDGLGMFVRKDIWDKYPFDEALLTGFHCYDIDFSLQIAATNYYKNYVCCSHKVLIKHSSQGSFNTQWFDDTIRMHRYKWNILLPMKVKNWEPSLHEQRKYEEKFAYEFVKKIFQTTSKEKKKILKEFLKRPITLKHFLHIIYTLKFLFR